MKKIILFLSLLTVTLGFAQNQTFTGTKTFTSPPKFNNLLQNDANTKILTVNAAGTMQWRDYYTFSSAVPTLQLIFNTWESTVTSNKTFKIESTDNLISTYMANNEIGSQNSSGKIYLRNNSLSISDYGSCIQLSKSPTQAGSSQVFVTMPDRNGQLALLSDITSHPLQAPTLSDVCSAGDTYYGRVNFGTITTFADGDFGGNLKSRDGLEITNSLGSISFTGKNTKFTNNFIQFDNGAYFNGAILNFANGNSFRTSVGSGSALEFPNATTGVIPVSFYGTKADNSGDLKINISTLPIFENNSIAKLTGKQPGDIYRTSSGVLMIVY